MAPLTAYESRPLLLLWRVPPSLQRVYVSTSSLGFLPTSCSLTHRTGSLEYQGKFSVTSSEAVNIRRLGSSTGSAGLIQTTRLFTNHSWVAAVLGLIATIVGWTLQGVGNAYYYRKVRFFVCHFSGILTKLLADLSSQYSRGTQYGKGLH